MNILLPVDGSDYTQRMLGFVASHSALLGPQHHYTVCTVVAPVTGRAASFLDRSSIDGYYRDEADKVLGPLQGFVSQPGWTVRAVHLVGNPAEAIAEFASAQQQDLIVMGTQGHSVLGSVVMGSVTSGVISGCKTPVLLVR